MSLTTQKSAKGLIHLFLLLLVTACAATPPATLRLPAADSGLKSANLHLASPSDHGLIALEVARDMLGTPYRYGGNTPRGFDCSGLIQYAYRQAGVRLPRTSQDIFRSSQLVSPQELQPGDLVFFAASESKPSHVGIYDTHDRFIHAPSSGKSVSYASLKDAYWRQRLIGVGRF